MTAASMPVVSEVKRGPYFYDPVSQNDINRLASLYDIPERTRIGAIKTNFLPERTKLFDSALPYLRQDRSKPLKPFLLENDIYDRLLPDGFVGGQYSIRRDPGYGKRFEAALMLDGQPPIDYRTPDRSNETIVEVISDLAMLSLIPRYELGENEEAVVIEAYDHVSDSEMTYTNIHRMVRLKMSGGIIYATPVDHRDPGKRNRKKIGAVANTDNVYFVITPLRDDSWEPEVVESGKG